MKNDENRVKLDDELLDKVDGGYDYHDNPACKIMHGYKCFSCGNIFNFAGPGAVCPDCGSTNLVMRY